VSWVRILESHMTYFDLDLPTNHKLIVSSS
jgi:hypothetical protein